MAAPLPLNAFDPANDSAPRLSPIVTRMLLVVDDDPIQRRVISKLGVQAGHDTRVAATFDEAVAVLQSEYFDCVTIDLGLGEHNGVDLLRMIALQPEKMDVIVISGASEFILESTRNVAYQAGLELFDLFQKPLDLAGLREAFVRARQNGWKRQRNVAKSA